MTYIGRFICVLALVMASVVGASADDGCRSVFNGEKIIVPLPGEVATYIEDAIRLTNEIETGTATLLTALDEAKDEEAIIKSIDDFVNYIFTKEERSNQIRKLSVDGLSAEDAILKKEKESQELISQFSKISPGAGIIDIEVLSRLLKRKTAEVARIELRKALKRVGGDYNDLALYDISDQVANELLNSITSSRVSDQLVKAALRYAVVSAGGKAIEGKVANTLCDKDNEVLKRRISRNIAYLALSQISQDGSINSLRFDRIGFNKTTDELLKSPAIEGDLKRNYADQLDGVMDYYNRVLSLVGGMREARENLQGIQANLDLIIKTIRSKELLPTVEVELIRKVKAVVTKHQPELADKAIAPLLSLLVDLVELKDMQDRGKLTQEVFQQTRKAIYTVQDRTVPTYCSNEDSSEFNDNFKECLPTIISHAVLDNLEYDDGENQFVFDPQGAIAPIAEQAGHFGGESNWFFHLVIGMGSVKMNNEDWVSMASEQIGFGYKPSFLRSRYDGFVTKLGAYTSGLLYEPNIDGVDKRVIMGGGFVALDILETVQLNGSIFAGRSEDGDSINGYSIGLYIPLGEYLAELVDK